MRDGYPPEVLDGLLENALGADGRTGKELLSRRIMAQGLLAIQRGESAHFLELRLYSLLGEEYLWRRVSQGFG